MDSEVEFSQQGHIGLITLKRPKALNALTLSMIKAMQQQLLLWQTNHSIHAIVIQAEPGKAFCAGGDVRWLYEAGLAKNPEQMQFFWHEYRLNYFISQLKKPYISFLNGITMGGGVGISLHGSHPIATEHFIFAMPETGIGFFPDIGASYLLARCPSDVGIYLGLTGERLQAQDAMKLGLVKQVIAANQLENVFSGLMHMDLSANAHQRIDSFLREFAMPLHPSLPDIHEKEIYSCFSQASVEKIMTALQENGNEWAKARLKQLSQKAPLSLQVTLAQIQKASHLNLAECLQMDYRLVQHFMADHDFYEGVRALLVDKDKSPQWNPDRLAVAALKVKDYLAPTDEELDFEF